MRACLPHDVPAAVCLSTPTILPTAPSQSIPILTLPPPGFLRSHGRTLAMSCLSLHCLVPSVACVPHLLARLRTPGHTSPLGFQPLEGKTHAFPFIIPSALGSSAALAKCHEVRSWGQWTYCLTVVEARGSRSQCQQDLLPLSL